MHVPRWIIDVTWNCSVFLNVIINPNKKQQQRLVSLEEERGGKCVLVSAEFVCAEREIKDPDLFYSWRSSFVGRGKQREREREQESPYVHWRQPEASVYLKALGAAMIRGCEPNTFIRPLRGDRSRGAPRRRIKTLRTEKKWNNLFQEWSGGDLETSVCVWKRKGRRNGLKAASSVCVR